MPKPVAYLGVRMSPEDKLEAASEALRKAEESVGTMTNILRDDETMRLEIPSVGEITMVRKTGASSSGGGESLLEGVELPDQEALRNGNGSLVASLFRFDEQATAGLESSDLASKVIAVTSYDDGGRSRRLADLDSALVFRLRHESRDGMAPRCAFWDFDARGWSEDGCEVVLADDGDNVTTCRCNHLTNFAVILALAPQEDLAGQEELLRVLTLVLCSLSAVCLVLSLVYFAGEYYVVMTLKVKRSCTRYKCDAY